MKTARIDVFKDQGEGLKLGANVSIVLTGKIKGLDTYDVMDMPMVISEKGEKKGKKESSKVTINLEIEKTEISESKAPKKTSKEAFDESWEKKEEK